MMFLLYRLSEIVCSVMWYRDSNMLTIIVVGVTAHFRNQDGWLFRKSDADLDTCIAKNAGIVSSSSMRSKLNSTGKVYPASSLQRDCINGYVQNLLRFMHGKVLVASDWASWFACWKAFIGWLLPVQTFRNLISAIYECGSDDFTTWWTAWWDIKQTHIWNKI